MRVCVDEGVCAHECVRASVRQCECEGCVSARVCVRVCARECVRASVCQCVNVCVTECEYA